VPLRGVQPMTFEIRKDELQIVEGRNFTPGHDELIVGKRLVARIANCHIGDVIVLNKTPFRVVGVFDHPGSSAARSGATSTGSCPPWAATGPTASIAQLKPGTVIGAPDPMRSCSATIRRAERARWPRGLLKDNVVPAKVYSEQAFLASQTVMLSFMLVGLGIGLASIMGLAAIFTAMNTMLSARRGAHARDRHPARDGLPARADLPSRSCSRRCCWA
jgi:putative ABC transport system permease protein